MLPSFFHYIFVHLKQKVRFGPKLSQKFLSTSGPNPARTRTRPEKPVPTYNSVAPSVRKFCIWGGMGGMGGMGGDGGDGGWGGMGGMGGDGGGWGMGIKISLNFEKLGSISGRIPPPHQPKPNDFGRKITLNFGEDIRIFEVVC